MEIEKLSEVRAAYKERIQLREKIEEFESMRISPRGAVYGSERVQTTGRGDIQPDNIAALDALLERYNAKLKACIALIDEFEQALEGLTGRERLLMRMYYIDGKTWEQVCVEMHYSWMHMSRMRKAILKKLECAEDVIQC